MIVRWFLEWWHVQVIELGLEATVVASLMICTLILFVMFRERKKR